MQAHVEITGIAEIEESLSYLKDRSARRIGRAAAGRMATVYAQGMRRFIPKSIRPSARDKGIGSRTLKTVGARAFRAKAGIRVGNAAKNIPTAVNRGKRKGVGVSANNLHWFALGTKDRFTGRKKSGNTSSLSTGNKRRFTGRLDKEKWGGFIQKGVQATELPALEAARTTAQRMIDQEAAKAKR